MRHDVYLDERPDGDRASRASYQSAAILSGESADTVHTPMFTGAAPLITVE